MSGGIEEPYTIAQLSRPIQGGKLVASPVCSLNASRKRKRHEVCVGVDGEGVTIYSIQNQSAVTSYPLPPQSHLAAPPCSIYCKRAKPLRSRRQTYVALRDGSRQNKARLISFTEELGKVRAEEKGPRLPAKREYQLRHGEITGLDVLPPPNDPSDRRHQELEPTLLVCYRNGTVECLSSDLLEQRWLQTSTITGDVEIEYATVVDLDSARKGLLKNREDVLAVVDMATANSAAAHVPLLLVQILRSGKHSHVRICSLRNTSGALLQSTRAPMEELLSYELASRHGRDAQVAAYELHAGSGMLYQRLGQRLTIFDLSYVIPKVCLVLGRKGGPRVKSFARLSAATVLVVSDDKIAVYETKYGSVLSSLELAQDYQHASATASPAIVSQFLDLGIITATSGASLVAFQIGDILDDGRHAKPLLIDVMGKSKSSETVDAELPGDRKQEEKRKEWDAWTSKVDQLVEQHAVNELEDVVLRDLHMGSAKAVMNGLEIDHSNLHATKLWSLSPNAYDPQYVSAKKALYLLGRQFSWGSSRPTGLDKEVKLKISFISRNILRWLTMAGYTNATEIERALRNSIPGTEGRPRISPGEVVAAIQDAEPTFTLLCDVMSLPVPWDLAEVVMGLKKLILSLQDKDRLEDQEQDIEMTDDADDGESRILSETAEATRQLEIATRLLESPGERSQACRILLARLQTFPQKVVAVAMHEMLTYDELYFFISILRVELFDGNWAMQYVESRDDEDLVPGDLGAAQDIRLSNQAIKSIARLFSCAIDAVGMSGWLVGLSADTIGAHEMIQSLRNEIAAATEGLYDASYIEILLNEVGKTAGSLQEQPSLRKRKRADDPHAAEDRLLPLGGRVRPGLSGVSVGKRVHPAVLAEQRSRAVGKYSFERIRI